MRTFRPEDCFLSAVELAKAVRERDVSPVTVVDALAERIGKVNPKLNAYVTLDLAGARAEAAHKARALEERPGADRGLLFGVPVAVKDDLPVKGMPLTGGSRLSGLVPDRDDLTVERLRQAGAILLGKTHLPEFGHKGTTDNLLGPGGTRLVTVTPWHLERTAGGSSGGSASAVAAGLAFLALGTDIGGSIRIPASCCGVVGFKPSFGLVPRVPSGNAFSLWVSGPIARSVADVALAMRVLAGPHSGDRFCLPAGGGPFDLSLPLPGGLRVAWYPRLTREPVEAAVEQGVLAALERWAGRSGRAVTLVRPDRPYLKREEAQALRHSLWVVAGADLLGFGLALAGLKSVAELAARADLLSPTFRRLGWSASGTTLADYLQAQSAITAFCEGPAVAGFADCDLIACPTLAVPPFSKDLDLGPDKVNGEPTDPHLGWAFTWPFNLTGEPAVSVPCGWTADGLPLGLQLVGRRGQDGLVLRAAAALEALTPSRRPAC